MTSLRMAVVALVLSAGSLVSAQDSSSTHPVRDALSAEPDGGCLARDALAPRVTRLLGRETIDATLTVRLLTGDPVRFVVTRGDSEAERAFEVLPEACDARLDAVALAIAIAIDHTVLDRLRDDGSVEPPQPEPPPAEPETVVGERPPTQSPRTDDRTAPPPTDDTELGAGGFVGLGVLANVLADVAPALFVGAELLVRALSVRLSALGTTWVDGELGRGVWQSRLVAGVLELCLGEPLDALRLGGCASAGVGAISSRGRGFDFDRRGTDPWVGVGASGFVELPAASWLALRATLGLSVTVVHTGVAVTSPTGAVLARAEAPPIGGTAGLSAVIHLR